MNDRPEDPVSERPTPERLVELRRMSEFTNGQVVDSRVMELWAEIAALRAERDAKWGPSDRAYFERDREHAYAEELVVQVAALREALLGMVRGGGQADLAFGERILAATAPQEAP